jgi:hypothetical protein
MLVLASLEQTPTNEKAPAIGVTGALLYAKN